MTFTINSKQLLAALNLTAKGISANNITPSASCYRFHSNDGLEISTCNLEISMQTKIAIELDALDILIPADKITQLLASLPDQALTITVDNLDVTIKWASGECQLAGYSADGYPVIKTDTDSEMVLPAEDLAEAIYATGYARSADQTQLKFTGLSVIADKNKLQFAGCNLLCLAVFNIKGKFKPAKMLLPPGIANTIGAINIAGECRISYSANSICFEYDNLVVKSLLMDEQYPDYMGIVPKNEVKIACNRAELLAAIKRVLQFTNKEKKISLKSDTGLTLYGFDAAYKQSAYETVKMTEPNMIEISVNGDLLSNVLSHFGSEQIEINWQSFDRAIVINEPGDSENFAMVMAMVNI